MLRKTEGETLEKMKREWERAYEGVRELGIAMERSNKDEAKEFANSRYQKLDHSSVCDSQI
jgi:hypothetical protein